MSASKVKSFAAIVAALYLILVFGMPAYAKSKPKKPSPAKHPDKDAADDQPKADENKTAVNLSERAEQMCAGAGGKLLIFHLKQSKKLAIVDLVQAKVVHSIDLPSDDICIAAGQDYLFVGYTSQKLLHRYSLKTFEREKTIPIPGENPVGRIVMGSGSAGPLALIVPGVVPLLDPISMKPITYDGSVMGGQGEERVSADGQTFIGWGPGSSPLQFLLMHLDGNKAATRNGWSDGYNGAWLIPNADGSLIFRNGGVISTGELKGVAADTYKGAVLMPTESPAFFLALRQQEDAGISSNNKPKRGPGRPPQPLAAKPRLSQVAICTAADLRTLHTIKYLEPMTSDSNYTQWGYFHGEPRIRYLPQEKLLAVVPESNDAVFIRKFDLEDALKKAGEPYLFIVSKPAASAKVGADYAYTMQVLSSAGGVKYHLESGPDGMSVAESGEMRWHVPAAAGGTTASVVVALRDAAGKEVFHSFTIDVAPAPIVVAVKPKEPPKHDRPVASATKPRHAEPSTSTVKAPPPAAAPKIVQFPEPYDRVCTGGSGRYLFCHLKGKAQIAMVDLVKGEIVHNFDLSGQEALFTAGADSLVIALPAQKVIQRWNLKTFRREKTAALPFVPQRVLMGSCSRGPLLVWTNTASSFYDLESFQSLNIPVRGLNGDPHFGFEVRVSADGQSFTGWTSGITGQGFSLVQIAGNNATVRGSPDQHSYNAWWAQPNADGSMVLRYGGGRYSGDLKVLGGDEGFHDCALLPTEDPRIFLAVHPQAGNHAQVTICTTADSRKVITINDLENVTGSIISTMWALCGSEPRVHYLPKERVLAVLPDANDRVTIREFSLVKALEARGDDYVYVVSRPVCRATVGSNYEYDISALAKGKTIKCRLETGPKGMAVSESGEVRWNVAARPVGGIASVVISVSNASGTEVQHAFEIVVSRPDGSTDEPPAVAAAGPAAGPAAGRKRGPAAASGPAAKPKPAQPTSGDVAKIDDSHLELPVANCAWVPGLDYRTMLVLCGDRLAVLGPDGITIQKHIRLPKAYVQIAERKDYYVALAADPKAVEVIDKKTLKVLRSLKLNCTEFSDLALHPTKPVCYVAMKDLAKTPTYHFVVYNEKSGDGRESDEYVGTWIKPEPKGRFMMVGYKDLYEAGSRLLVNPGRVDVVPEYGDISWLIRYSLDAQGMPSESEVKEKAGGNAQGIRLSRDGLRVTFLSHVGYPEFSGNLAGWDPKDLKKIPVTYPTKDKATTYDLAYHPMLPLVASPGSGSAVFFHRETGDVEENRLTLPADGLTQYKLHNIQFSPDGKNLIFHVASGEVHYLVKAALRLSPAELRIVEAEGKRRLADAGPEPAAASEPAREKVALKNFEALKGGMGRAMTTKDVGHWFMDSVVVIKSEDTSGTGFVVGSGGYIVTCAHCIPEGAKLTVSYRDSSGEKIETRSAEPRVLATDADRDLALLKIDVHGPLRPVRLAGGGKIESGERVAVIGNPGVGTTILDYTLTEGIVSSPDRRLEGQSFIQTSAQVNPGSSGGPMFNSNGLVIGIVVLKARLEGAGFAIPADDVMDFLLGSANAAGADGKLARYWTDSSGTRRIEATFGGFEAGNVKLQRPDGQTVSLPLTKLSESDRKFIDKIKADTAGADGGKQ